MCLAADGALAAVKRRAVEPINKVKIFLVVSYMPITVVARSKT
jgi:hypothetical protein